MAKKILMIAGEPSGDLHAANLALALKNIQPDIELYGVGGKKMLEAGVNLYQDIKDLSCFGVFDAILHIRRFLNLQEKLLSLIQTNPPDLIILIDFSGFNLRFAKKINNRIPIFYYISPQVWASRPGRIKTIKKYIKKMLVIFEFEKRLYQEAGVDVEFVGHPLLDIVKPTASCQEAKKEFGLKDGATIIALLPGSRKIVVKRHLPIMLEAASIINKKLNNSQFLVVKNPALKQKLFTRILSQHPDRHSASPRPVESQRDLYGARALSPFGPPFLRKGGVVSESAYLVPPFGLKGKGRSEFPPKADLFLNNNIEIPIRQDIDIKIVEEETYDCLNVSDFVITSSGTATLETAIMEKPMLIVYKMGFLSYLLYRPQVKVPYIGMVNIVAGKKIIPELIQFKATPELIADEALEILNSTQRLSQVKQDLALLKEHLGPPLASQKAAGIIVEYLKIK